MGTDERNRPATNVKLWTGIIRLNVPPHCPQCGQPIPGHTWQVIDGTAWCSDHHVVSNADRVEIWEAMQDQSISRHVTNARGTWFFTPRDPWLIGKDVRLAIQTENRIAGRPTTFSRPPVRWSHPNPSVMPNSTCQAERVEEDLCEPRRVTVTSEPFSGGDLL